MLESRHFCKQDISKPEAPRLRRNLSAIINFCKFRDEKVYAFEELNQRLAALSQEAEAAEEQRAKNVSGERREGGSAIKARQHGMVYLKFAQMYLWPLAGGRAPEAQRGACTAAGVNVCGW